MARSCKNLTAGGSSSEWSLEERPFPRVPRTDTFGKASDRSGRDVEAPIPRIRSGTGIVQPPAVDRVSHQDRTKRTQYELVLLDELHIRARVPAFRKSSLSVKEAACIGESRR